VAVSVGVGRGRVVGAAALGRRFGGGDLERDRERTGDGDCRGGGPPWRLWRSGGGERVDEETRKRKGSGQSL
jgi:hypothetical protein